MPDKMQRENPPPTNPANSFSEKRGRGKDGHPPETTRSGRGLYLAALPVALALFFSGGAGLVNEVVWQRALKRLLGGSESTSSMIVVVVFMFGLGVGSILMGNRTERVRNPLRSLALLEGLLALAGTLVCLVLRSDLQESIVHAQFIAVGLNIPLPVVFGLSAALLLLIPCLLMGATVPLASEACQRNLGFTDSRVLGVLFFVNTLGAVFGAILASFYLIPRLGFTMTMALSVALNAGAGLILLIVLPANPALAGTNVRSTPLTPDPKAPAGARLSRASVLMFGLGFCSLGYEMLLFRLYALELEPLPYTFAIVLSGFLLFWSLGAGQSARADSSIGKTLSQLAIAMAFPFVSFYLWWAFLTGVFVAGANWIGTLAGGVWLLGFLLCFAPCLMFGYAFAWVAATMAQSWGRDVGRLYAWNTAGACSGVLLVTLFGYELHFTLLLAALIISVIAFRAHWLLGTRTGNERRYRLILTGATTGLAALLITGLSVDFSMILTGKPLRMFFGREGVIGVDPKGSIVWNGLWHSKFSDGSDHVGTNNWMMAAAPVMAHSTGRIREACVIGLGAGITSATLAKLDSLRSVDTYEINRGLAGILSKYETGSLGVLNNPKVNIFWQDARAGIALNEKRYDLFVAQPLYLRQSGSGLLNSREFLELLRSRLQPDGIVCLFSRGTAAQKLAVRETAATVFTHGESFNDSDLLVLSQEPIRIEGGALEERFCQFSDDPLWREIAGNTDTRDAAAFIAQLDRPRLSWDAGGLIVTDDHPVIEYPGALAVMLEERGIQVPAE